MKRNQLKKMIKINLSNNFKDIEIELKYWACVIKYLNTTAKFSI